MRLEPPIRDAARYPATTLIILAAAAVSLWWWASGDVGALLPTDAAPTLRWWQLITSTLPHLGPVHLLFNLLWMWYLGVRIERVWGPWRALGTVAVLAAASSSAEFLCGSIGVGLSGVVYGLVTLLYILGANKPSFAGAVDRRLLLFFGVWFVACIGLTAAEVVHVGNVAHAAGAAVGALLGGVLRRGASAAAGVDRRDNSGLGDPRSGIRQRATVDLARLVRGA